MTKASRILCVISLMVTCACAQDAGLKFAELGDFKLESGEVLRGCRIGYRTFGTMNAERSNILVGPTWAGGTSAQMVSNVGPGKLFDSSHYFVALIDALANGVSSSPSNNEQQPRMKFPRITIHDMVGTQHEVLTRVLGIRHVKAVMGISMGGMQTFEWMVDYPDFMDVAIPIVGSPRLAPYDLLHWQSQIDAIRNDPAWKGGEYTAEPARESEYEFGAILLTTPEQFNRTNTREQALKKIEDAKKSSDGQDANNKIRQTEAMMALDVSAPFGGSLERAAAAVKAKVLVIVARQDHVVTPGPAMDFARLLKSGLLVLKGDCGHLAPGCESTLVNRTVSDFLPHNQ